MTSRSTSLVAALLILAACGGGGAGGSTGPTKKVTPVVTRIVVYAGDDQVGTRGNALPAPLCTNVFDQTNHLMLGVPVTYTVATGSGSMGDPATAITDGAGVSTSGSWTLGPNAGAQTVVATAGAGVTVTFRATAN